MRFQDINADAIQESIREIRCNQHNPVHYQLKMKHVVRLEKKLAYKQKELRRRNKKRYS
jgi:hypothetical protein